MPTSGYVYVYYDPDKKQYKIGKTKNIKTRKQALQTGNPTDLQLCYYLFSNDYAKAESGLHLVFSAYRQKREWFKLDDKGKTLLDKIFTQVHLTEMEKQQLLRLGIIS